VITESGVETKNVTLTVNGRRVVAPAGSTILEAARSAGIRIPTLCHHPDLSNVGACRICVVSVGGAPGLQTACTTPVREGMEIDTESEAARATRRFVLEMLLTDHPNECMTCEVNGDCELQDLVYDYEVPWPEPGGARHAFAVDPDPNPFIAIDRNKCILCTRCVRACGEIQNRDVWSIAHRGFGSRLVAGADQLLLDARCESCGQCVAYCPVGALYDKMSQGRARVNKVTRVRTTCSYCGVGCSLDLNVRDGEVVRVTSTPEAPVNGMALCVKGRYGYDYVHHPDRLTAPLLRARLLPPGELEARLASGEWRVAAVAGHRPPADEITPDAFIAVDWATALDVVAGRFAHEKANHGADSFAMLASAKCTNEENYLFGKFTRQILGTNNIDHCARLCHSATVAGLATSFGSGAMTNSIRDIAEDSRCIFVIGSNTTEQHPVIGIKLRRAQRQRGVPLIVADPRRIDLAEHADLFLRHRPGTDIALLNGLMHVIVREGWADQEFIDGRTEGFADLREVVDRYPPEVASEITGVPAPDIERAARLLAENRPGALLYSMGITQHTVGVANVVSCANLQMLLGNMGIPGGGVNPLRGQSNVQGACDMGALPNVYSGYQRVTDDAARAKFSAAWGVSLPDRAGLTVTEMLAAAEAGRVRCLYVIGENPMVSDPDLNHVRRALEHTEFLVVQDLFLTETARFADVVLPAVAAAEKDGTLTNTERRVQRVRRAVEPPGDARSDTWIVTQLARGVIALGAAAPDADAPHSGWDHASPAEVMGEIGALTPSYAGITYARLDAGEQLQWPVPDAAHPGTPILHVGRFSRGLGRFVAADHLPPDELPDDQYPLVLTTGRVIYHWHGGEMTRRARGLKAVYPEALVEIHPEDAAAAAIVPGGMMRVASRRGEIVARAQVTDRVEPGLVFATFHFPDSAANFLTNPAIDPVAKIPEYKVCAVRVEAMPPDQPV
jgi:formate dehydrogenase alpha subunit